MLAISLHNLGMEEEFYSNFENSKGYYERSIGTVEEYLGQDHPLLKSFSYHFQKFLQVT